MNGKNTSTKTHQQQLQQKQQQHGKKDFNIKRCILRSFIIALAVTIAELLPQFDMVMGIIGGTLSGPLIFILPPLFYRRLIQMERDFDERNEQETLNSLNVTSSGDDNLLSNNNTDNDQRRRIDSYGTFAKPPKPSIIRAKWLNCLNNDSIICISVVVFGLIVTITSTYFNLMTVSTVDDFGSPCIQNISFSFGEL